MPQETWSLEQLRSLVDDPAEQTAYAVRLLPKARDIDLILAAIAVIGDREDFTYRPVLLQKYAYCDANGVRRDQGGTIRRALLNALRPIVLPEDVPLLERVVTTYEFLFGEAAGDLRAAGLLVLDDIDEALVGYHCVRLLDDQYTSIMSGEPALSAVRILASQRQYLPLYAYVMREEARVADVVAESLRSLTKLPASLLPAVIEKYRASENEIVLIGLFDLLLAHETRSSHLDMICEFLESTMLLNVYRYLLIVLMRTHDPILQARLQDLAAREQDEYKLEVWHDVAAMMGQG